MIKYILFVAALLPFSLVAQTNTAGKIGHSEVVEVKGATASTLTSRATAFLQSKKIEAKTVGTTISGEGAFVVSYPSVKKAMENGYVKFKVKIMVKDGKYKVDLTDFHHEGMQGRSSGGPLELEKPECGEVQLLYGSWIKIKEQNQEHLKAFVQDLKTKMDNPTKAAPATSDF